MTFDPKDRAIVVASSLVGYCQSFPTQFQCMGDGDLKTLQNWHEGLVKKTEQTAKAIEAVLTESNDESSK